MDFTALTAARYSVRKFEREAPSEAQIEAILEVARNAPTACNRQPQRIFVVSSEEGKKKIRSATECHFNAPLFFVVCYDRNCSWHRDFDGQDYGMTDASIVVTQMMLKITELGLGSCFVAWFDPAKLRQVLELPPQLVPVAILPCGTPAADARPAAMHDSRKLLSELVTRL